MTTTILDSRSVVSRERFDQLVREKAWWVYLDQEPHRRYDDWLEAVKEIWVERRQPKSGGLSDEEIRPRAQAIYEDRKEASALQD